MYYVQDTCDEAEAGQAQRTLLTVDANVGTGSCGTALLFFPIWGFFLVVWM